jgi:hypothetical protein
MASLEDLQAEIARREAPQANAPAYAPISQPTVAAAPQGGLTQADILAEIERRKNSQAPTPQEPADYAGLAGRTAIKGATGAALGIPALAMDAVGGPINLMYAGQNYLARKANETFGTNIPQAKYLPSQLQAASNIGEQFANMAGMPQPQTPGQKAAVDIGATALSALGPGGWGRIAQRAATSEAAPIAQAGQRLAATPALDVASGAIGETASKAIEQKGGGVGEQTAGGLLASTVPYVAAAAGRRVVTPFPSNLTPEQQKLAGVLQNAGVDLSAGQLTGSKPLQYTENAVSKLPLGDLISQNPTAAQRGQFTQAALQKAGVNAEAATPEVLNRAHNDIGQTIGNITQNYPIMIEGQTTNDLNSVAAKYGKSLKPDQKAIVQNYIDELKGNWALDGTTYQNFRSDLGKSIRAENGVNGDKRLQEALIGIQDAVDNALERSMKADKVGVQDIPVLQQARQQYANLLTIEDAVARSGQAGAMGEINPSSLSAATKAAMGKRQYVRGYGDLNELARAGDAFIRPLPESGTAPRQAAAELAAMAGGGYAGFGPLGAAAMLAGPPVTGALVNSRLAQMYLRNQALAKPQQFPIGGLLGQ